MIGCQPSQSAVMAESVKAGTILDLPSGDTLSDGTAGGIEENAVRTKPALTEEVKYFISITSFIQVEIIKNMEGKLCEWTSSRHASDPFKQMHLPQSEFTLYFSSFFLALRVSTHGIIDHVLILFEVFHDSFHCDFPY